ncbi:MAG: hypothetical protein V4671_25800 [Armatimonadota bacterium]
MEITRFAELRPRIVRDILDDAFDLYRERFALLAGVSAVAFIPPIITALAVLIGPYGRFVDSASRNGTNSSDASFAFFLQFIGITILVLPLIAIAQLMQTGATCIVVEDRLTGRSTTIVSAWRRMLQRIGPLIAVAIASGLLTLVLGTVLSIIGSYLVMTMTLYVAQIVILEGQGTRGALSRSWSLASQAFGKSLGFVLLTQCLGTLLWIGLCALCFFVVSLVLPPQDASPDGNDVQIFTLMLCVLGISLLLVAPIHGIGATLLYYDLRVRREGIDIVAIAEERGYPLAPDPFESGRSRPAGRIGRPQSPP